jgi:hypothetical protein
MSYNTPFSSRLRLKLDLAYGAERFDSPRSFTYMSASWYIDYLVTTYSIIRASVPLMRAAYEQCKSMKKENRMVELQAYYEKHIQEELYHDEWLLEDLQSIGQRREIALTHEPPQEIAELVGSQYYWIYHWHPVCLLGYISVLEGNPPKMETILKLKDSTGFPDSAFRTLIKHSTLDPHHRDDLNTLLDTLPLSPLQEKWVTSNSLYTANKLWEIRNY